MAEYIELLSKLRSDYNCFDDRDRPYYDALTEAIIALKPIVHGHWITPHADPIDMMFLNPKCSKCGFESADHLNYCPNCGARMDEYDEVD